MKVSDIVALAHAGFTAEQITKLATAQTAEPAPEPAPKPTPEPAPKPAPVPAPAPVSANNSNPVPANDNSNNANSEPNAFSVMTKKMDDFMNMIMANNIMNSNQPKPVTADDVIASIINPTHKED